MILSITAKNILGANALTNRITGLSSSKNISNLPAIAPATIRPATKSADFGLTLPAGAIGGHHYFVGGKTWA